MEGSVATRKVRAKRFVECFMESFRIVDFLSPIAPGWIYDGRRTRKRTSAMSSLLVHLARDRKYKRILFKFSKSPLFTPTSRWPECFPESDPPSSCSEGGRRRKYFPVPVLFRIIDVKNILEALINVGREDIREGWRRRSSHMPSCYWISIGKRLFLSSDRGCHFGSFVTEVENSVSLFVALSRAGSTIARFTLLVIFLLLSHL